AGRRRGRHGAHARPLRPVAAVAVDTAHRAGAHAGTARRGRGRLRRRGRRPVVPGPRDRARCRDHRDPQAGGRAALDPARRGRARGPRGRCRVTDQILSTYSTPVREEWIDYNGHLSEAYYVLVFGFATDAAMEALGLGEDSREATGCSL